MSFHLAFKILVQSAGSVGNKSKTVRGKIKLNFRPKLAATEKLLQIHHKSGNSVQWFKTKRNYAYKLFITIFNFNKWPKIYVQKCKNFRKIVELKCPGNIHIYTWHPSSLQSFRKFHYKMTDKLSNRSKSLYLLQQNVWVQYD